MAEINKTEAHPYLQMREGGLAVAVVVDGSTKELNRSPPTRKYERVGCTSPSTSSEGVGLPRHLCQPNDDLKNGHPGSQFMRGGGLVPASSYHRRQ